MVRRKGVAATLASTVVFASLLASNFVILSGDARTAFLAQQADKEDALADEGYLLAASVGFDLLGSEQTAISSIPFDCRSATSGYPTMNVTVSSSGASGVEVTGRLSTSPDPTVTDNFSLLGAFSGSRGGAINFSFIATISATDPVLRINYTRAESSVLSLPGNLGLIKSFCLTSANSLVRTLGHMGDCNRTRLSGATSDVSRSLQSESSEKGLSLSMTSVLLPAPECFAEYVVKVSQYGLTGPLGNYEITGEASGEVPLPGPN